MTFMEAMSTVLCKWMMGWRMSRKGNPGLEMYLVTEIRAGYSKEVLRLNKGPLTRDDIEAGDWEVDELSF